MFSGHLTPVVKKDQRFWPIELFSKTEEEMQTVVKSLDEKETAKGYS